MAHLPRGIAPELLLSQVKNTMPYLFEQGVGHRHSALATFPPSQVLRNYEASSSKPLTHVEYFRLCVSSHYLTCATPVPTDVDNQIRHKLWPRALPLETALEMASFVLESRKWDFTTVTRRFATGAGGTPCETDVLSGHHGEWFTVACAAYCALGQYKDPAAAEKRRHAFEEIADEVKRHAEIFGSLWRSNDGLRALKASAGIAHNLGDLDRVMDMWDLPISDPLRLQFYKLGSTPFDSERKLRYQGRLWVAGELYKSEIDGSAMALENHRHFALRKPKCLRQSGDFLIPTGPFFDDWGRRVARELTSSGGEPTADLLEVVEALKHGWDRLPKTVGYGRALRGILEIHPKIDLGAPPKSYAYRSILDTPQDKFESKWAQEAVRLMDDIPSRA